MVLAYFWLLVFGSNLADNSLVGQPVIQQSTYQLATKPVSQASIHPWAVLYNMFIKL